jgi:protein required for attachment to host cells
LVFRAKQNRLREIMTDNPGRSFASEGTRGSAMEYHSDPVCEDERAFAAMLAEVLDSHRLGSDFDRLTVFAAPQTLGDLRQTFLENLRSITFDEIPKDFAKLPAPELLEVVSRLVPSLPAPSRCGQPKA